MSGCYSIRVHDILDHYIKSKRRAICTAKTVSLSHNICKRFLSMLWSESHLQWAVRIFNITTQSNFISSNADTSEQIYGIYLKRRLHSFSQFSELRNKCLSWLCVQDTNIDNLKTASLQHVNASQMCVDIWITLQCQSTKQERERTKYVSKSGATVYDKFAHVPPISVRGTNISRSEAISFHRVA